MAKVDTSDQLGRFLQAFKLSEDYVQTYFDRSKTFYKNYRLYRKKEDFPYANSVFTPDTFNFVEDSSAKIVQSLLSRSPVFACEARFGASVKIASQMERALSYMVENEDFEFFVEFLDFMKGGDIFGTSFMGMYPDFEIDENNQFVFFGPRYEYTDFWDIYPDPNARRLNRFARYIIKRSLKHIDELHDLEDKGIYYNVSDLATLNSGDTSHIHRDLLSEIGLETYVPDDKHIHEVLEMYSAGHIITIGDRGMFLRDTRKDKTRPYPYSMPIVDYRYVPVPGEFYGIGIPEIIKDLQADKNIVRSQRRENVDLILNKILKIKSGGEVDIDTLKFFPGALWFMGNLDDVAEMDLRDVTQSAYMEEEHLDMDMERATGQYRYSQGQAPKREETATGIVRLQQAALSRLDISIKLGEFYAMRNIAQKNILMMRTYMPQSMYEEIIGEDDAGFYQIPIDKIRKYFHVYPVGASITQIKELRAKQIMEAVKLLSGIPPQVQQGNIEPFTINYKKLIMMALSDALDIKNLRDIIMDAPPPMPAPSHPGMGGPGQGPGGGPPEQLLREALMQTAPNKEAAQKIQQLPLEKILGIGNK